MIGTIRTLRVDKGFGFIKGETGQEVLSMARASQICARAMESSSKLPTVRRGRGRRTSSAPRRKRASEATPVYAMALGPTGYLQRHRRSREATTYSKGRERFGDRVLVVGRELRMLVLGGPHLVAIYTT